MMPLWVLLVLICLGCYLVGTVPFGYLAGLLRGVDIRTQGSGNTGATNVGRLMGRGWGVTVFLLDALKGFVPTVAVGVWMASSPSVSAMSLAVSQIVWLCAGMCCVLGHSFPVYLGFRGGKGVATSLGVVLGIYPVLSLAGGLAFGVWGLVVSVTRIVSLASVVAAISLPLLVIVCASWRGYSEIVAQLPIIIFAFLISALVLYRHRSNLARLRAGQEKRVGDP